MKKSEIAKTVIKNIGGIARTADFLAAGLSKPDIGELCNKGVLIRIRQGFYQLANDTTITEAQYISALLPLQRDHQDF